MSLITMLDRVLEESKAAYEQLKAGNFVCAEQNTATHGERQNTAVNSKNTENIIAQGDNLAFMKYLTDKAGMSERINLVYIDPPFFSKAAYDGTVALELAEAGIKANIKVTAYRDCWETGVCEYLTMLTLRLLAIRDLLAEDGCVWVHLDWHVVHYVKLIMDEIFGEKNFVNEIIWNYKSGGSGKKSFAKKHDTLLFYSKSEKYYFSPLTEKSYNRGFKPYRFKGVKEYQDEVGWYTMVNMKDVWPIDMVGRTSGERTGYATQKPEALLERIVMSCSREGDICADFFGGSGTLAAVAQKNGRRWISCDMGDFAIGGQQLRLHKLGAEFDVLREAHVQPCGDEIAKSEIEFCRAEGKASQVVIKGYSFVRSVMDMVASDEDVALINMLSQSSFMKLISFWSVDFDYDGVCHCPDRVIFGGDMSDTIETTALVGESISVHITDIFGNRTERVIGGAR